MSDESHNHNLLIGAAVAAGILGTLSALIRPNFQDSRGGVHQGGEKVNKNLLLGGLAGGIIGAATALVLAPKSGSELMKDIAHTLTHPGELLHSSHPKTSAKSSSRKSSRSKSASSKTKGTEGGEPKFAESGKSLRPAFKKKSPSRKRTASANLKGRTPAKNESDSAVDLEPQT